MAENQLLLKWRFSVYEINDESKTVSNVLLTYSNFIICFRISSRKLISSFSLHHLVSRKRVRLLLIQFIGIDVCCRIPPCPPPLGTRTRTKVLARRIQVLPSTTGKHISKRIIYALYRRHVIGTGHRTKSQTKIQEGMVSCHELNRKQMIYLHSPEH